jgi:signal transduction histidine kinase
MQATAVALGPRDDVSLAAPPGSTPRLLESVAWLVRLRWFATGGVGLTVALASMAGSVVAVGPLGAVVIALAVGNVACGWIARRISVDTPPRRVEAVIQGQILFDLVVLTAVLHWSGGVDNPFATFYVFHMALAAMLLPFGRALVVAGAALLLHAGELVATSLDLIDHVPVLFGVTHLHEALHQGLSSWRSSLFVAAYLVAFAATQLGVIYFVGTLAKRQRQAELNRIHHERVARSRERLARIGVLAAGVAHSVRNPLHGLLSCVDILERSGAEEEILGLMKEGVGRIDRVTRRLLALGRDEPIQLRETDLGALVEDACRLAGVTARQRDVELSFQAGGACPAVQADADRLLEAIVNLLDNAAHASPPGSRVDVRLTCEAGPAQARIVVADRGSGIPEAFRERVFDPFFTTKPVGEGTGLGLAITRTVIEEHGGEIRFVPRAGGGTEVVLGLPLAAPR